MKYRFLSVIGVLAMAGTIALQAQDYDDIYYDGSSSSKVKTEKKSETVVTRNGNTTAIYTQQPVTKVKVLSNNYQTDRDVDEYNRRGISEYDPTDTLNYIDDDMAFANTQRIERFYNPDIVVSSNDDELIELYYDDTPTVNLIIGSNYGYVPRVGWGIGYGSYWYDPWYGWYDPWYTTWYSPWYSWGWHRPYYGLGWYSGWYGWATGWHGWGWHHPYYGWNTHHHNGWGRPSHSVWDRPGHHANWGHNGMRPRVAGDSRSLLNGRRSSPGSSSLRNNRGARANMQGLNREGAGNRQGSMTGRPRPNTGVKGQSMTGRSRTSTANVGNVGNRSIRPQGTSSLGRSSSGISSGSMRGNRSSGYSSGSSSSGYRGSSSSRSYSPSHSSSSSYGGSRSSGSYSGGSSRGSSGGSHGSSGGGGSRGGGGGHRH